MSRTSGNNRNVMNICRYIIVLCLAAAAILLVWLLVDPKDNGSRSNADTASSAASDISVPGQTEGGQGQSAAAEDNSDVVVDVETTAASSEEANTAATVSAVDVAQVGQIIDQYYDAKIDDDVEALNNIVDAEEEYKEADLAQEMNYITKYDNFRTYVLPGYTDDYFIVYVRYDIYFTGITTGAPSLNHFIVSKDADGYYCIYNKSLSGEFQAYLEETEKSDTVMQLKAEVEADLQKACEENEDLKYLMQMLSGNSEEETTVEETTKKSKKKKSSETTAEETTETVEESTGE